MSPSLSLIQASAIYFRSINTVDSSEIKSIYYTWKQAQYIQTEHPSTQSTQPNQNHKHAFKHQHLKSARLQDHLYFHRLGIPLQHVVNSANPKQRRQQAIQEEILLVREGIVWTQV